MSRPNISAGHRSKLARLRSLELPIHEKSAYSTQGRFHRRRASTFGQAASLLLSPTTPISPYVKRRRRPPFWKSPRLCIFALIRLSWLLTSFILILCFITAIIFPSYTRLPAHYSALRDAARTSNTPGRVNPRNERIFIASSIYDPTGEIIGGSWGRRVKELVEILGPENTFVSIFESDSGDLGKDALQSYEENYPCQHKFVAVDEIELQHPALITLPDGAQAVKRIEYLAEARNRALLPLRGSSAPKYDRLLYLNDVIFDPVEAAQLLLSTNLQYDGRPSYKAACAQDFKSPFLMYDMLAARDVEGRQLGVPLFPWFANAGAGKSRADVLQQSDAVEVKSCWGGMAAFDATYFQEQSSQGPMVTFRAEQDLLHESSECCLIHADLLEQGRDLNPGRSSGTQIFVNPYVRTAYDESTFRWLWLGRRVERLFPAIHRLINYAAGMPYVNALREVRPGDPIKQILFRRDSPSSVGQWQVETTAAKPGSYCAIANLMVRRFGQGKQKVNWETVGPEGRDRIFHEFVRS